MLLYSTRTAVLKNEQGKSVLLCKITLPIGAEAEELDGCTCAFYKRVYELTYAAARAHAQTLQTDGGRLLCLTVKCAESISRGRLVIKRTYSLTGAHGTSHERVFVDKFKLKCDKTKKYSIKERPKYNK